MAKFNVGEKVYVTFCGGVEVGRVQDDSKNLCISFRNYTAWVHRAKCHKTRAEAKAASEKLRGNEAKQLRARAARDFRHYVLPSLREAAKLDPEGAKPDWMISLEVAERGRPHLTGAVAFCKKHLGVK